MRVRVRACMRACVCVCVCVCVCEIDCAFKTNDGHGKGKRWEREPKERAGRGERKIVKDPGGMQGEGRRLHAGFWVFCFISAELGLVRFCVNSVAGSVAAEGHCNGRDIALLCILCIYPWTYYRMDTGFQNGAHSFLCKLLNGAGQHQGEICFRIMGA